MSKTFSEKQKTGLLKKYHTLVGRCGIDKETQQMMLVQNYGVTSSRDLTAAQLLELCDLLDRELNPELEETWRAASLLDKARKRVLGAIGGWLKANNLQSDINIIKKIACRAAKATSFNAIGKERLNSLYAAFNNRKKDLASVGELQIQALEIQMQAASDAEDYELAAKLRDKINSLTIK